MKVIMGTVSDGESDDKSLVTAKVMIVNSYEINNVSGGMNNDKRLDQVTRKNYINFSEDF